MPDASLLYLVRHGETDANVERRYAGWSDDRLNATGRSQAEALALRWADRGIDAVFTSPVRRAVETAEILSSVWGATLRTVHDLHEIEIGPWRGHTEDEVRSGWPEPFQQWRADPVGFRLPGRETLEALHERALRAVDQIGRARLAADGAPAVVVTHLAVIRVLWLSATGRDLAAYHELEAPHCEGFPLRWVGRGRLEPAGPPPSA